MNKNVLATAETSVQMDLLNFYDQFTEFQGNCAFMCDALVSLIEEEHCLEKNTAGGVSSYSQWIKARAQALKIDLKRIHKKTCNQLSE